jgi:hypothetical protein
MLIDLLVGLTLLAQAPDESPFNAYSAHLEPRALAGACCLENPDHFRDLTYVFRGKAYPHEQPIQLHDGRYDDPGPLEGGVIDWSTTLEEQSPVRLNGQRALMLRFFSNHLGGSGSVSRVFVLRCANERLQIVFEGGGEGVRASFSQDGSLQVSHPYWRTADSHAEPSRMIREWYGWSARSGRFGLIKRADYDRHP